MNIFHKNEPLSSITHLIALLFSVAGLVILIVFSIASGKAAYIAGFSIFGVSLVLLYSASTLYHLFGQGTKIKNIFRRIDHAMIYVLIAGTYTPICLAIPQRVWGWSLFAVVWGIAATGIALKIINVKIKDWAYPVIYLAMGWMMIVAIIPLLHWLSFGGLRWLFLGGILYSLGCIFYGLDNIVKRTKWFGMHEVFHVFVVAGSFSHFWLMIKYVLYA